MLSPEETLRKYTYPTGRFVPRPDMMKVLRGLKDIHKGKRAFLWGNGPSLNKADLSKLRNEITFSVNRAYILFPKIGFDTTYWLSVEGGWFKPLVDDLNKFGSMKFIPRKRDHFVKPDRHKGVVFIPHGSPREEIARREAADAGVAIPAHFSIDVTKRVEIWKMGTTGMALQMLYWMGTQTVILIGQDWEYKQDVLVPGDTTDYFSLNYFPKGFEWAESFKLPHTTDGRGRPGLAVGKDDFRARDEGMEVCRKAYEADGRKILNATVGGKLEVFPRVDYGSCFEG